LLRRTRLDTVIRFYETEGEAVAVSGHAALLNPSPLEDGSADSTSKGPQRNVWVNW
jgi:hypothetical protein